MNGGSQRVAAAAKHSTLAVEERGSEQHEQNVGGVRRVGYFEGGLGCVCTKVEDVEVERQRTNDDDDVGEWQKSRSEKVVRRENE